MQICKVPESCVEKQRPNGNMRVLRPLSARIWAVCMWGLPNVSLQKRLKCVLACGAFALGRSLRAAQPLLCCHYLLGRAESMNDGAPQRLLRLLRLRTINSGIMAEWEAFSSHARLDSHRLPFLSYCEIAARKTRTGRAFLVLVRPQYAIYAEVTSTTCGLRLPPPVGLFASASPLTS
jgi:hypothetical protein